MTSPGGADDVGETIDVERRSGLRRPRTASAISATVVLVWSEVPELASLSTDERELEDRRRAESAVDPAAVEYIDDDRTPLVAESRSLSETVDVERLPVLSVVLSSVLDFSLNVES